MIDSHSHVHHRRFDNDRRNVLVRAIDTGITHLIQIGCSLADSQSAVDLVSDLPGAYATVGVHPHDADSFDDAVSAGLRALVTHPKVVALGEMGLDYYYEHSPRASQLLAFERQLKLAQTVRLPLVIHTRDAEEDTLALLKKHRVSAGGHVHCFTGSMEMALALLDLDFHIGFTGIITFKNSGALRDVVKAVPMERLLIETDSPYLAPGPKRGKRNEPSFVTFVAEEVAKIKGLPLRDVIDQTADNTRLLFAIDEQPTLRIDSGVTL